MSASAEFLRRADRPLVIAASPYAAADLVRAACEPALIGVEIHTLRTLVFALSSDAMNARGFAPLQRVAREAIAASLARRVELEYLREVADFPGFPSALARTLEDLRLQRIPLDRLRGTGRSGGDLARLSAAYEEELQARRLADYAARVEYAIAKARTMAPRPVVLVDLDVCTAAERELLDVLMERASERMILRRAASAEEPANGLEAVKRFVFSGAPAPARAAHASVALISASSESLEAVEIARRILHSGVAFDDVAILLRHPRRQGPLIREALERAGIPAWYAEGSRKPDSGGRAFLTLLACREENFSATRFAEYLSLGQVPREEGHPQFLSRWERLLREAAVIAGADRWNSRLTAAAEKLYKEYEKQPDERLAKDIAGLEELRGFAVPLIEQLAALPLQAMWSEWLARLEELGAHALAWPQTLHEALDELAPVADLGPVTLAEVRRTLERRLMDFDEPAEGYRYGKVFVAPIEQARGMQFRMVFIPGLNEGSFPRPLREDPLLLDDQRAALGMETARDDNELLQIALACATESATCSFARLDLATGRERVPSFFAVEVLKAARGSDADLRALLAEARARAESRIGWSAPLDPADAIDDVEYDLAAFRKAAASREPGSFSWIAKLNSHAIRSLEARSLRWQTGWSRADGLVQTDVHTGMLLAKWRLGQYAWPVTALEQYARCPYRFLLAGIHHLKPMEEPEAIERMDALGRGRLYHRTLFRLFREGDADLLERLDVVLDELAREAFAEQAPRVRGIWDTSIEKLRADLRGWLVDREPEWKAVHGELAFGLTDDGEHDAASSAEPVTIEGRYRIKGSIDLVEQRSDGRLRIVDHKTGRAPTAAKQPRSLGNGEVLQPLLYTLAAEAMLGQSPMFARLSYGTLRGGYRTIDIPAGQRERAAVLQVLAAIDQAIDRAFLPAAPGRDACKGCEYVPVCGPYEELRVQQKSQPELRDLAALRKLR